MNSAAIFKKSKSNFASAFLGLPKFQRKALEALYAYCRVVDDIADESETMDQAKIGLAEWRTAFSHWPELSKGLNTPIAEDLTWAIERFPILRSDLMWILEGVEKDLVQTRYQTMDELIEYCDAVASAVGFCCMSIFGVEREKSKEYVLATGRALQLTNILRDIASDAQRGRVYLPISFLFSHGLSDHDLLSSRYDDLFLNMVRSFSKTIHEQYLLAQAEAMNLPLGKIWPTEVMRKTYFAIFQKIQRKNYNVYSGKIAISKPHKMWIALTQSRA